MKKVLKKVVACTLAVLVLVQPLSTAIGEKTAVEAEAASSVRYIKSAVKLRKTASSSAKVIKVLKAGTKVTLIKANVKGWSYINAGGYVGYVGKKYLTTTRPATTATTTATTVTAGTTQSGTVTASKLTVRAKANSSSAAVGTLKRNAAVTVTATSGDYYYVISGSIEGYVKSKYISVSTTTTSSSVSNSSTGTKGQRVVNYALRFVGNPYVYGGTSLTNGTDCSGFTMSVYKYFGYTLPRTSSAQRTAGTAVSSLSKAEPGDLICYSGHVAIYMGNNKIVHAANSKRGIVAGDSATYATIVAVRRIIQ